MTNEPSISVLMPVYNAERYVAQAVQSILDQTFSNVEFLIVNDGSTDRSLVILEEYAEADPRIRLVTRPNTGYVVALNEMLDLARGQFIARMDADDISLPTRFENQVEFLSQNPAVWVVGSSVDIIDDRGRYLRTQYLPTQHDAIDDRNLNGDCAISHPSAMFRKREICLLGGYRMAMMPSEDLDLWLRVAEHGKVANLEKVLLQYRFHSKSVSRSRFEFQMQKVKSATGDAMMRRGLTKELSNFNHSQPVTVSAQRDSVMAGWWALSSGQLATARSHALASVLRYPISREAWWLFFCAMRGR